MKISKSKQELARIISENGGWRDGAHFASQGRKTGSIGFTRTLPHRMGDVWWVAESDLVGVTNHDTLIPNWHQCILSREEYLHLHPEPDDEGWIECNGSEPLIDRDTEVEAKFRDGKICHGSNPVRAWRWTHDEYDDDIIAYRLHRPEQQLGELCDKVTEENKHEHVDAKPTIEQLAAEYRNLKGIAYRKQAEADAAKADAEAKLAELVAAGNAIGLVVSVADADNELAITDWRDLRVGDVIRCVGNWEEEKTDGREFTVTDLEPVDYDGGKPIRIEVQDVPCSGTWGIDFQFIRRP